MSRPASILTLFLVLGASACGSGGGTNGATGGPGSAGQGGSGVYPSTSVGHVLQGRVIDGDGAIATGTIVTVEASTLKTTVDATGTFKFAGLPAGPYTLFFEDLAATGGRQGLRLAADVETDLDLKTVVLGVPGIVQGFSPGAVQPQWNATAVIPGYGQAPVTVKGPDATFEFDDLLPGAYTVHIMMKIDDGTYRMSGGAGFQVVSGMRTGVNFEAVSQFPGPRPGYPLDGMLRNQGQAQNTYNATVTIEGTSLSTMSVVGNSYFWTDGVPPGLVTVDISAPNFAPVSVPIFVGGASENPSIPIVTLVSM